MTKLESESNRFHLSQSITAVFRCEKIRVIIVAHAGSAGLFARPILIQVQSAVNLRMNL